MAENNKVKLDVCLLNIQGNAYNFEHVVVAVNKGAELSLNNIQRAVGISHITPSDMLYATYTAARDKFCAETHKAASEFDSLNEAEKLKYGYDQKFNFESLKETRHVISWSRIEPA